MSQNNKPSVPNSAPKAQKINRLQIGTNVLIQLLILVAIIAMVNYIGFNHFKRWDHSRDQKYALSQTTRQVLDDVQGKIKFVVFFSPQSPVYEDVQNLLKEFHYAARSKVDIELVDPYKNFTRARELQGLYKFGAEENVVIVDYDGRQKFVGEADMAEIDNSGMLNNLPPRITAFRGEQAIAGAVLEVTEGKQKRVLFLSGLGGAEPGPDATLRGMVQMLERQNVMVESLSLPTVDVIPEDTGLLVISGARYDLPEREMELLKDYWNNKGRLLVLLNPDGTTPRLHAFLTELGITPNDDRVLRTVNIGPMVGILREVTGLFQMGHPITKELLGVGTMFMGQTQSLKINEESNPEVRLTPLITATEGFWGETTHVRKEEDPVIFLPSEDTSPPLHLAVAAEKGALEDSRMLVDSSRLVVVSNSDLILDDTLNEANIDFLLSSANWLLAREALIGITPKEIRTFTLQLTDAQVALIFQLCVLAVPAVVAVFGFAVWWRRRA